MRLVILATGTLRATTTVDVGSQVSGQRDDVLRVSNAAPAIRDELPEVQFATASNRGGGQAVFAENNGSTIWQGVDADYFAVNDWELALGEGFSARDDSSVASAS